VEELGAEVNARDANGYTPLHHAAARGDNEMILYLVSRVLIRKLWRAMAAPLLIWPTGRFNA
jgi:ankyrin repeat protein